MESDGEQEFQKRLRQFYEDVVMNAVRVYFELEVLKKTPIFSFLESHKHKLFHEFIPTISCCECLRTNSRPSVSKIGLEKSQFDFLYDRSACAEAKHEIKNGQHIQQYCVCNIKPKLVEVADLDIILIRKIMTMCFVITLPGRPEWFKEIHDVRNCISHRGRISKSDYKEKWRILETNALEIAFMNGKTFQSMIQKDTKRLKAEHDTTDRIHEEVIANFKKVKSSVHQMQYKM